MHEKPITQPYGVRWRPGEWNFEENEKFYHTDAARDSTSPYAGLREPQTDSGGRNYVVINGPAAKKSSSPHQATIYRPEHAGRVSLARSCPFLVIQSIVTLEMSDSSM